MLNEWTVIREEIGSDMDRLGVPNLTILQTVLLGIERGQEAKLSANAEVGNNDVECFVQELVFGHFCSEVTSQGLLSRSHFGVVVGCGAGCHEFV